MSYEEVRADLAELYGWTFAAIDEMSFEQISSACAGGKKPKLVVHTDEEVREMARDWRQYYGV